MPAIRAGIMGTNTVLTSIESALAARAVGPPHGSVFMTPEASMVTQASTSGLIPRRRKSGSMAAVVIMYVVEPSPSSDTSSASAAVPTTTFMGSP